MVRLRAQWNSYIENLETVLTLRCCPSVTTSVMGRLRTVSGSCLASAIRHRDASLARTPGTRSSAVWKQRLVDVHQLWRYVQPRPGQNGDETGRHRGMSRMELDRVHCSSSWSNVRHRRDAAVTVQQSVRAVQNSEDF